MHRFFLRLACLACVTAMAFGCDSENPADLDSSENPPDGAQTGTLHGTVMIGGSPLGGAELSLAGPGVTRTATSGADGAFAFAGLPPGSYTLTTAAGGATCDPVSTAVEAGQNATATIACEQIRTGGIVGTVTAGGAPLEGVSVLLRGYGARATTDASGAFAMASLLPGAYTLVATPEFTPCESMSVVVEADQTVPANIVCQPVGAVEVVIERFSFDGSLDGVVILVGPEVREAPISGAGSVRFLELPPGEYTVTATASTAGLPVVCNSATAIGTVEVGRIHTVRVEIACSTRIPLGSEIARQWAFGWYVLSQTGSCPVTLPADPGWEDATVFITFDASAGTITLAWYWYDVRVVGHYDPASGNYAGQGSADLGGGASIRTEIEGAFGWFQDFDFGGFFFGFDGSMKREHWTESGDSPICTEEYQLFGVPRL